MKKKLAIMMMAVLLAGCSSTTHQEKNIKESEASAAETTASPEASASADASEKISITNSVALNTKTLDMGGYVWLDDKNPNFIQITMAESLRLMDEGGSGIVVYSYDTCPFCNRAIPVLNQAAKEAGIYVYYVDVYEKELMTPDGQSFSEEGNATVKSMMTHLDSILKHERNEETGQMEPALYTPEVVAIKNGQITGHHVALVDDFKLKDQNSQMSDAQKEELKQIYLDLFKTAAD